MTKKIKLFLLLLMLVLVIIGCSDNSSDKSQLNVVQYPEQIMAGKDITIKGEFLTTLTNDRDINVILTIRELETDQGLLTKSIDLTNQSQEFSFTNLELNSIKSELSAGSIYFEFKLIINGQFKLKSTTEDDPTLLANWHTDIITTYFTSTSSNGEARLGTWGNDLTEENPYYFALPYRDFYYYVDGELTRKDYYGVTDVKNRWIEIYYSAENAKNNYVYAQWEDVGPWNYYDPHYVFSNNDQRPYAEMGIDMGWSNQGYRSTNGAGLDLSATAMKYLTGNNNGQPAQGKIKTNWRFISEDQVPAGPWLNDISKSKADVQVLNLQTKTLRNIN